MKRLRPSRLAVAIFAVAASVAASPVNAQAPSVPFGQGSHAFRHILHKLELRPLSGMEEAGEEPKRTIIVVFGDVVPSATALDPDDFISHRGAVLVATDRDFPAKYDRLHYFGASVDGSLVQATETHGYRGLAACPVVKDFDRDHPIFAGVLGIATNRPSFLWEEIKPVEAKPASTYAPGEPLGQLTVLASFPTECTTARKRGPKQRLPFAAGMSKGEHGSRFLLLADHSVFINDMMLQIDNDNFVFAYNCMEWLAGSGDNRRDRVLFVDEGTVNTDFDVPFKEIPIPVPPVGVMNQLLANLEQENLFDNLLIHGMGGPERALRLVLRGLAIALSIALVVYGVYRLARGRYAIERDAPVFAVDAGLAAAVVEQRHQALLREGNLWEAARELARQCFTPVPGKERAGSWSEQAGLPRVSVAGGWWRRWVLRNHVRRLWQLAHGSSVQHISHREFAHVLGQAAEVRAALEDGSLQLGP